MTTADFSKIDSSLAVPELTELVRGNELQLLDRIQPLVRRQSVTLDLENVGRIDAAGLAALITLHCDAGKAGHRFAVANPSPHVREILALVGLEALLVVQHSAESAPICMQCEEAAA